MADAVEALLLDLLEWIGPAGRPYGDVIDAWRTSCPRLPIWEEANARGFVLSMRAGGSAVVHVTGAGFAHLAMHRARVPGGLGGR